MDKRSEIEEVAHDEINFAEFSMSILADRSEDGLRSFAVEDTVPDGRGGTIPRRLTVAATGEYGLPTPFDDYVLIALIAISKFRNGFQDASFETTRREILTLLGWRVSGRSFQRIEESFTRLASTFYNYEQAWQDLRSRQSRTEKFHIFSVSRSGDHVVITWSPPVFKSLNNSNIKSINLGLFLSLRSPVSRRLYRFLNIHLTEQHPEQSFDLLTLAYCKVGLAKAADVAQVKRRLRVGIAELEAIRFIKQVPEKVRFTKVAKGQWLVHFVLATPALDPTVELLIQNGIGIEKSRELVAAHTVASITRQVEALPDRVKNSMKPVKSLTGLLIKAIEQDYAIPDAFHASRKREEGLRTQRTIDFEARSRRSQVRDTEAAVQEHLDGLDRDALAALGVEAEGRLTGIHPKLRGAAIKLAVREIIKKQLGLDDEAKS